MRSNLSSCQRKIDCHRCQLLRVRLTVTAKQRPRDVQKTGSEWSVNIAPKSPNTHIYKSQDIEVI